MVQLETAGRVEMREHEQVEDQDLRELNDETERHLELPIDHIRDDGNQQDREPEDEDRTLPQPRRGQLGDELVPRQEDARDDRNQIKRYGFQARNDIVGPDEHDRDNEDEEDEAHRVFPERWVCADTILRISLDLSIAAALARNSYFKYRSSFARDVPNRVTISGGSLLRSLRAGGLR